MTRPARSPQTAQEAPQRPEGPRRAHLTTVPTPAEQGAFESWLVGWLVDVNAGWLRRQGTGR